MTFQKGQKSWKKGLTKEICPKLSNSGRKKGHIQSESEKIKRNNSLRGQKRTNETRNKMRESALRAGTGKWSTNKKGIPLSSKHKEKISKALVGRIIPEDVRKKMGESRRGEKAYNWISDRTKLKIDRLKMFDSRYMYWTKEVKNRDNWKCRISSSDCKGRLESHHILDWENYPELRYDINNGITLCHAHHPRGRRNEAKLSPFFQQLVAEVK